ncbi:MAG TPA: YgeY family selenium metabolism-linked hydrolase [Terracidiphilus sp.]|nr:YgeY family selenium metabolism-linked hydrolase [Terracidiphilus sp.]
MTLTSEQSELVVALCQSLVQRQSYSGHENAVVERMKQVFKELKFDEVLTDEYGNVLGRIKGNRPGKVLLLDGHIDTVPVPDESKWTHNPFGGEVENGKIYGRGTSDMKGAVSAMIVASAFFAEDTRKDFAGDIYVSGVVHEECFEGIAARKISERIKPDYVVIGESSELNLKRGQRGRAEVVIETFGKPAHSANPRAGINAVYKMAALIGEISKLKAPQHPILGEGILELTDIKSSPYPGASVVPDYCRATYDRRLLVGETKESVLAPLQALIERMKRNDPDFNANVHFASDVQKSYTGGEIQGERFFPGWVFDTEDEFVQAALAGLKSAGLNPEITQYSFCTNGSHYAGEAGIRTIGFGPSRENLAHTIDEYIEIDQLLRAVEGYYGILGSVLRKG